MFTVAVGLAGALLYGAADFFGGLAAKRIAAVRVAAIAAVVGVALMLLLTVVVGGRWSVEAALWGMLAGLAGSMAIFLLYAALAIGPMSILSPLTAVVSAIVPMTVGLAGGDRLGVLGFVALGLALVAVVLVGFVPEKGAVRPRLRGILYALGSGVLIGVFLVLMSLTPDDSGLIPLVFSRSVSSVVLFSIVGVGVVAGRMRGRTRADAAAGSGWRPGLRLAVICGVLDGAANALILVGLRVGELSVVSVLVALYPAGTIILAALVLRERIAPVQWVGLALALGAAGMLALV